MDNIEKRLTACFSAVLTELAPEEIAQASSTSVASWDSLAAVTLLAVVEEEFGIRIDDEDSRRLLGKGRTVVRTVVLQPYPRVFVPLAACTIVDIFDWRDEIDARAVPTVLDRKAISDLRLYALR